MQATEATERYSRIDVSLADLGQHAAGKFGICSLPRTTVSLEALHRLLAGSKEIGANGAPDVLAVIAHGEALGPRHEEEVFQQKKYLFFGDVVTRRRIVERVTDHVDLLVVCQQGNGFVAETEPVYDIAFDTESYPYRVFRGAGMRIRCVTIDRLSEAFDYDCVGCRDEALQRMVLQGVPLVVGPQCMETFARRGVPIPMHVALWRRDKEGILHAQYLNRGVQT